MEVVSTPQHIRRISIKRSNGSERIVLEVSIIVALVRRVKACVASWLDEWLTQYGNAQGKLSISN